MDAYIYRADIYCKDCAISIQNKLRRSGERAAKRLPGFSEDSDTYPIGPFSQGGGEADCPQACGACGLFLQNPLTMDGDKYVREAADEFNAPDAAWSEIAARARQAGRSVLAEWIEFYFAPGM